jgi:cell division protein FtsI (penicillin-binding protein 3)
MVILLTVLLLLLVGRVMSLQVLDGGQGAAFLQSQGAMRSLRTAEIPAYRGVISDRRGEPLAVSTPVISLWANPAELRESTRLEELAETLGMERDVLTGKLAKYEGKQFMYLQRHRVPAEARQVLDKRFKGVYGEREYRRFYPAGEVAAQLLGLTNVDGDGIEGLELAYNDWLRGRPGRKKYVKDLHGEVVRDVGVIEAAVPGNDLVLSIDLRLQYLQHRELKRAVLQSGAESGSVVTLDARTGEVLAMVNYPGFNPNNPTSLKGQREAIRNRAIVDGYEPGSTMKTLTLVAALESGRYRTDSMVDTAPGYIRVSGKTYRDPRNYGEVTLSRVIEKSSQVGVTRLALDLGYEPVLDVLSRFGLGQPLGTGFPGERGGELPFRPRWHVSEQISLAFGYGLMVSPLQIAHAYSVFANHGRQLPVSLLRVEGELPPATQVVDPVIASEVLQVLHAVTGEHGTARRARVPGYRVGGKTGTVHKLGAAGYDEDRYIALFAGIAPIDDPRLVTVVVINDPRGEDHGGGSAAAPVFSRVTRDALRLLNIPPSATGLETQRALAAVGKGGAA